MNIQAFVAGATNPRPFSVLFGRDRDVLPVLLGMHAAADPHILDCTYNKGRMWRGTDYRPVRMDLCPDYDLDVVADFRAMPFPAASFDVIVFDPPHRPVAAGGAALYAKYNEGVADAHRSKDNVSDLFAPFLAEAARVLRPNGVVLAKLADLVHNHRQQWQQVDFVNAARESGLTACDMLIKVDPSAGNIRSGKWAKVHHLRKCHAYWIVVRKGRCEK